MIIIIISFVVSNNIYANSNNINILENNSIFSFFFNELYEDSNTIEEGAILNHSINYHPSNHLDRSLSVKTENLQDKIDQLTCNVTMAGGNTIIKPSISAQNPLNKQTLREQIDIYTVQDGDTISSIANLFAISINTILWENKLNSQNYIKPGQKLKILPTSGITHTVKNGENLNKIAKNYSIEKSSILTFNEISNESLLHPGQKIIIPEGEPIIKAKPKAKKKKTITKKIQNIFTNETPPPSPKAAETKGMVWPTPGYVITQYYNWRHTGLDLDGETGDPIYSSDDGKVEVSAWNNGGYGFQVVVNHQNGIKTRYAHCSKLSVKAGDMVKKGDTVCLMGSTGRSTGSHLHYEVIVDGVRRNPLNYIEK